MYKKLRGIWNNIPLKGKILTIIILTNTLLFTAVSLWGIRMITNSYDKTLYHSVATNISTSAQNLKRNLDSVKTLSDMIIADSTIQQQLDYLNIPEDIPEKRTIYSTLYATLLSYNDTFKSYGISYISIYDDNFAVHTYRPTAQEVPEEIITSLNQEAITQEGRPVWNTNYTNDHSLFLTRAIRKINYMDLSTLGTLNIALDMEQLISKSTDLGESYDSSIYLLFNKGTNIYSPADFSLDDTDSIHRQLGESYGIVNINGKHFFGVNGTVSGYNWEYICLIPYDTVFDSIRFSTSLYLCVFLFSAVMSIVCSNIFINSITRHIEKLILKMNRFKGQKSTLTDIDDYDYKTRTDEIGVMHQQFNYMASEIQSLIQTDYENKLLMKDAQLKALVSQINPHFLYNTLEFVNWRAKAIGANDISSMIEALGSLFRASLSSDTSCHTIRQELELTDGYMTIQKLRFEERLTYETIASPELLEVSIPKLTVQPLVENSVRYALEQMTETCHITIRVFQEDENLSIQVRNNGSSFPENLLEQLRSKQIHAHGFGIGLLNIDKRLKLTFGNNYGLSLFNENEIAVAQIIIPMP
ncbi:MAG: sensor histidine kinase [Oliverpabstia sp.]